MHTQALALTAALIAAHAQADILTVRYDFPEHAGTSLLYGFFGGDHGPLEGAIISTTVVIESYVVGAGLDAADFDMGFDVPVLDAAQTQLSLTGVDLGWSGVGSFSHSFTSTDFNGLIRPGRFGAEFDGGGTFAGDAYVEFTVDTSVPTPAALGLLGVAVAAATRRRR
jgi:MYXO-CTERM domain-containing protein